MKIIVNLFFFCFNAANVFVHMFSVISASCTIVVVTGPTIAEHLWEESRL